VSAGHEVIGCDLSLFPNAVCGFLTPPHSQMIKDFRTLSNEDLAGVEAIAHLAGISNDPMGELNPGLTMKINGEGTVNFAKTAKSSGVRIFAFASSCSIYGSSGDEPRTEGDLTNPLSEYASSKLFAEQKIQMLASNEFYVYILRNATAYGASAVFRSDLVVNDLSAGISAEGIAEIKSDGSPWRPLIHCYDMARTFKEFIEKNPEKFSGKPVNIGFDEENFQVKDIGKCVQTIWPEGKVIYGSGAIPDSRNYKVNFSLLQTIFPGFKPEYPLNIGVLKLRKFLEDINYSSEDRESKRFVRLDEIQKRIEEL
jgi:nucleoside-diphosphate-sugar epimerase